MRKGSFVNNFAGNGASLAINLIVGIWFTAYLMKSLGPAVYGLVPLATTIASYMAVLTLALTSAVGRSITVADGAGNTTEVVRVFNTAFFGCVAFSVLLLGPALLLGYLVPGWISVPAGYENEARAIFIAAGLVFLLTTISTPYGVAMFCRNRLDLASGIGAVMTLLRVGIVWALFQITHPNLWQVGVGLLVAGVVGVVVSVLFSRRLMPELSVSFADFSRATLTQLGATGLWVSITQFGTILMLSVDLLMVNVLLGALAAGKYAIALQISVLMRQLFGALGGLFSPTIMAMHGAGQRDALIAYVNRAIMMVGFLAALAAGLLCGFAGPLLTVWLGPDFAYLAPLVWLMIAPLAINLAVFPMFALSLSVDKVRGPGLLTLAVGFVHVGLAWLLVEKAGWGMYGVAASAVCLLSLKNICYIPWYTARAVEIPMWFLLGPVIRVGFATFVVWGIAAATSQWLPVTSWLGFFAAGGVAGLFSSAVIYTLIMDRTARKDLHQALDRARANIGVKVKPA